ncbi:hypothetical protein [Candidatus Palauibacter sp.]|uniref:hypothetical protein n=1 Tax=Candidatus Palauibacter sp. TaxID=3101350 RepID=UPI003AF22928
MNPWIVLATVIWLPVTALAWAGFGRWLLAKSGVGKPNRAWWGWWFVPWGYFQLREVADVLDRWVHSAEAAWNVLTVPLAVSVGVAGIIAMIAGLGFFFSELAYQINRRRSP